MYLCKYACLYACQIKIETWIYLAVEKKTVIILSNESDNHCKVKFGKRVGSLTSVITFCVYVFISVYL